MSIDNGPIALTRPSTTTSLMGAPATCLLLADPERSQAAIRYRRPTRAVERARLAGRARGPSPGSTLHRRSRSTRAPGMRAPAPEEEIVMDLDLDQARRRAKEL